MNEKELKKLEEIRDQAELGNAKAQCAYYNGSGVTEDYKEAFKWSTKSAEQGNAVAQFQLEALGEIIKEKRK